MTPVVWAAVGLVAGLIVMWLVMRFTVLKGSQQQSQSLNARVAEQEATLAKDREELGKLESRLQYRENDNAELKDRLGKSEGQLRERQQVVAALESQVAGLESVRSDLERAIARMEDRVKDGDVRLRELEAAALTSDTRARQQQAELDKLHGEMVQRDRNIADLQAALKERDRQLAEAEDILDRQRVTLRSSSGADKGLRAAINRQQAEINALRERLEDALGQVASRNIRLTQLQEALSERKSIIADLRQQLHEAARSTAAPSAPGEQADHVSEPESPREPEHSEDIAAGEVTTSQDSVVAEALIGEVAQELEPPVQDDGEPDVLADKT